MRKKRRYQNVEKLQLIKDFMCSNETMETFQNKYGLGHCTLSKWMTNFGFLNTPPNPDITMKKIIEKDTHKSERELSLESKIAKLEKSLQEEQFKSIAFSTMIDVAESQLGIEIRKKAGVKQ